MCSSFFWGFVDVGEGPKREAVRVELPLMGGWWKTPWQFVLKVKNGFERQIVGKKRGVRVDFVVVGDGGVGGGCQVCPVSAHPNPPNPKWPRVPGQGREAKVGRGLSFRVAPGSVSAVSASVRKGIWRAWWRPPCYLVQAQKGVSRAFLPTCDHSLSA